MLPCIHNDPPHSAWLTILLHTIQHLISPTHIVAKSPPGMQIRVNSSATSMNPCGSVQLTAQHSHQYGPTVTCLTYSIVRLHGLSQQLAPTTHCQETAIVHYYCILLLKLISPTLTPPHQYKSWCIHKLRAGPLLQAGPPLRQRKSWKSLAWQTARKLGLDGQLGSG